MREGVGVFASKARFAPIRGRWVALEPVPYAAPMTSEVALEPVPYAALSR